MSQLSDNNYLDWNELAAFAQTMQQSTNRSALAEEAAQRLNQAMALVTTAHDHAGVVRLRHQFAFLGRGETLGLSELLAELNKRAIQAALTQADHQSAGQFLHEEGQALHRQGKHAEAIRAFEQSAHEYQQIGAGFQARESLHMTALCHRALGDRKLARSIAERVYTDSGDDPWRAHPLSVQAWLVQDDGDLHAAESLLREAATIAEQGFGSSDLFLGQALTDLAEVVGFLGRFDEASAIFQRARAIFSLHGEQRQLARGLLKQAEVQLRANRLREARQLLRDAYQVIAEAQYNDLVWRIWLAMAQVDLKARDIISFFGHLRLALIHRRSIGLSDWDLVQQYFDRRRMGTGLPR